MSSSSSEQFRTEYDDFDRDLVPMMGYILESFDVEALKGRRRAVITLAERLGGLAELRGYTVEQLESLHGIAWKELDEVHQEIDAMTGVPQAD